MKFDLRIFYFTSVIRTEMRRGILIRDEMPIHETHET